MKINVTIKSGNNPMFINEFNNDGSWFTIIAERRDNAGALDERVQLSGNNAHETMFKLCARAKNMDCDIWCALNDALAAELRR